MLTVIHGVSEAKEVGNCPKRPDGPLCPKRRIAPGGQRPPVTVEKFLSICRQKGSVPVAVRRSKPRMTFGLHAAASLLHAAGFALRAPLARTQLEGWRALYIPSRGPLVTHIGKSKGKTRGSY